MDAAVEFYGENQNYEDESQKGMQTADAVAEEGISTSLNPYIYPITRRDDSTQNVFGNVKIADPYRWLENPESDDTQTFLEEQNHFTQAFLERAGWRDPIRAKLTEMWDFKRTECPKRHGTRYFFLENSGLQNQAALYVKESISDLPRALLDPNELSFDGAASISDYSVSPNGELVAYSLSENGSDWASIYIKNVASGQNYLEVLNFTRTSPSVQWRNDNRAFFYSRFPKTKPSLKSSKLDANLNQKVYYHRVGTRQDEDVLVAEFPDNPTWNVSSQVTHDGQYLLIYAGDYVGAQHTFYLEFDKGPITPGMEKLPLFPDAGIHHYLANDEEVFYFMTNSDASNFKIVSFELEESSRKDQWTTLVSENPVAVIIWALVVANDKLAICYNEHLDTRLELRQLGNGQLLKTIVFEDTISSWDHACNRDDLDIFIRVESYLNPGILHQLTIGGKWDEIEVDSEVYDKVDIPYFNPAAFSSELVFYSNDDGENIPLSLLYKSTTKLDGTAPCLLIGHGACGKSLLPEFQVLYVHFAQNFDGVVAIANVRGGNEYGTKWWNDGRLFNKGNAIEDFSSAANFLINNKYTRASQLTALGISHGATTVAAAVNKHPELFAAAIINDGILDLLRFSNFTVGNTWVAEYGDVHRNDELKNLLSYSPLHNIIIPDHATSSYPAILVTASEQDDRVVPFHSYKYVAELQHTVGHSHTQVNPVMIRIYQNIGHDFKTIPTSKAIEKLTDIFCFLENTIHYEFHF